MRARAVASRAAPRRGRRGRRDRHRVHAPALGRRASQNRRRAQSSQNARSPRPADRVSFAVRALPERRHDLPDGSRGRAARQAGRTARRASRAMSSSCGSALKRLERGAHRADQPRGGPARGRAGGPQQPLGAELLVAAAALGDPVGVEQQRVARGQGVAGAGQVEALDQPDGGAVPPDLLDPPVRRARAPAAGARPARAAGRGPAARAGRAPGARTVTSTAASVANCSGPPDSSITSLSSSIARVSGRPRGRAPAARRAAARCGPPRRRRCRRRRRPRPASCAPRSTA